MNQIKRIVGPAIALHTYEITYRDGITAHASGTTAAKARYDRFLTVGDCFEDFREYLRHILHTRKAPPPPDAYSHIAQTYGRSFRVGNRVEICGSEASPVRYGTVACPGSARHYVHVVLDGQDHRSLFHPHSVEVIA